MTVIDCCRIDCGGASVGVHAREPATVLAVRGEVDLANVECFSAALHRFAASSTALIVDLTAAGFLDVRAIRAVLAVYDHCFQADGSCLVVTSDPLVRKIMEIVAPDGPLSAVMDSADEALRHLSSTAPGSFHKSIS